MRHLATDSDSSGRFDCLARKGGGVLLLESDDNLIRQNLVDRDPPANIGTRFSGISVLLGSDRNVLVGNDVENHNRGIRLEVVHIG